MTTCNRCKRRISEHKAETCWFCHADLCYQCWDEFGHCGHKRADEINEQARKHYQQPAGEGD